MDRANFETYLRGQEDAMTIILKSFGAITPAITMAVSKHCARLNRQVTNLSAEHARTNAQFSASSSTPSSATATAQPATPAKTPTKPGFSPGGAATLFGGAAASVLKSRAGGKKRVPSTSGSDCNDSRGSPPETSEDEGRGPAKKKRFVSRGGGQSRSPPKFGTAAMMDTLIISSDSEGDSEIEAGPGVRSGGMDGKKKVLGVARKSAFANGSGYKPGGSKGKEALFVEEEFDYGDSDMSQ